MNERLMWDPPGRAGGILTDGELAACLRVLRALSAPRCATVLLTWPEVDQRAYVSLTHVGYVGDPDARPAPSKATAPFRWARIAATDAGLQWLTQVERERQVTPGA